MALPASTKYAVIGAGIHGLSTAFHLAEMLKASGRGSGEDILILDKTSIAAGASGIACGVVRNNYFQPAMRELMAHSVAVWESDPDAFSYHPVGYMQISPECMREDVASIYEQQKAIGYESVFIEGADDSRRYMKGLFDDWQAQGITSVLHEKKGGYANNIASMRGLADKAKNRKLKPDEYQGNTFTIEKNTFTLNAKPAAIAGLTPPGAHLAGDPPRRHGWYRRLRGGREDNPGQGYGKKCEPA